MQRIKTTQNVQQALVRSLGLSVEELSDRWNEYWRQRYFPEVAERQTLTSVATQITTRARSGSYNTSPTISPRGDRIAMITNKRGVFDVVVVDATSGDRLKTIISGADNPMFEELNILNPNLSWSPDGSQIALSSKSQGSYNLAIVDYESLEKRTIKFPQLDAINSVAWSPDGQKIAFDGNMGPYQDIFVYNLETDDFVNLTNDVFNDKEPAWGPNSEIVYFVSNRGDRLQPNTYLAGYSTMQHDFFFQSDLYSVRVGSSNIERMTNTPGWSEKQPAITNDGRMVFVSDQNGIPNIYEYDLNSRSIYPITDLQSGIMQISVSSDGTRLAFNSLNQGYPDIFLMRSPFSVRRDEQLTPNTWALERDDKGHTGLVPAIEYAQELIASRQQGNYISTRLPATADSTLSALETEEEEEETRKLKRKKTHQELIFEIMNLVKL